MRAAHSCCSRTTTTQSALADGAHTTDCQYACEVRIRSRGNKSQRTLRVWYASIPCPPLPRAGPLTRLLGVGEEVLHVHQPLLVRLPGRRQGHPQRPPVGYPAPLPHPCQRLPCMRHTRMCRMLWAPWGPSPWTLPLSADAARCEVRVRQDKSRGQIPLLCKDLLDDREMDSHTWAATIWAAAATSSRPGREAAMPTPAWWGCSASCASSGGF